MKKKWEDCRDWKIGAFPGWSPGRDQLWRKCGELMWSWWRPVQTF